MNQDTETQQQATGAETAGGSKYEIGAALLLGFAALGIAFGAYQSALWGGIQDENLTLSIQSTSEAVDLYQQADSTLTFDQTLFIEVLVSGACDPAPDGDDFVCEQIFGGMSPQGLDAYDVWTGNDEFFPFDSDNYLDALYTPGDDAIEQSDLYFAHAQDANANGDDYELASTILTMVLFFAGISLVIRNARLRTTLLVVASVLLVGSAVNMLGLERTF